MLFVRVLLSTVVLVLSSAALAQEHQHPPAAPPPAHEGHVPQEDHAAHGAVMTAFPTRDASGTAWLPDATPMYGYHLAGGGWDVMLHGNAFLQFLAESGARGADQLGSINWFMAMARRPAAGGQFGLRAMLSLEPWTIRGCGYPDLLATGEFCDGEPIHDRQHPHDLFMELAAEYTRPITSSVSWQLYGGLAGEPALGPVAYPHRVSALPNPLAPTGHHWLDATHITFGVATAGLQGRRWKAEASLFNGREPDEDRLGIDLAAFDSVAGRVWWMPTDRVAFQVSAGHLAEAEAAHEGGARHDVARATASMTYHRPMGAGGIWASTLAWGRNAEEGAASHALLLETNVTLADRDAVFGRFEVGGKPAHDLDVHGTDETFTVSKLQAGYVRYLRWGTALRPGVGVSGSASFVPRALEPVYGERVNLGVGVFLTLRPAPHGM